MQRSGGRRVAAAAVAVAVGAFAHRFLTYSGFSNDHFVHLATGQQMLLGEWPVRDYVERGIPLMSAVSAAAQALLGRGLQSELQLIAAAYAASAVLTFVVAVRLSGSIAIAGVAAAMSVLVHPASYSYPKLLTYGAAFAAGSWYCRRPGAWQLASLAGVVVIAGLYRHDHGVFLGLASLVMLVGFHGITRAAARAVVRFAVFAVVFAAPYVLWVQVHEGVVTYVRDGVAFSRREAERSAAFTVPSFGLDRTRPLLSRRAGGPVVNVRWSEGLTGAEVSNRERAHALIRLEAVGDRTWRYQLTRWSGSALERLVQDPAVADTHGIDRSRYRLTEIGRLRLLQFSLPLPDAGFRLRENALALLYCLCWLVPLAALALLVAHGRRVAADTRALLLMVVAAQLLMNVTMLRDPIDLRIRDVVVPLAAALAFLVTGTWATVRGRMLRWMVASAAAALLVGATAAAGVIGSAHEDLLDIGILDGAAGVSARWLEVTAELAPPRERTGRIADSYRELVDYVQACTEPDARLFAMTFVPELFFFTGRGFAGGQVTLTPGYYVTDRHATLMLDRLARENVPFVVLDSETQHEMAQQYPRVMAYVAAAYHRVAEFTVAGDRRLIVLAENRRAAVREFGGNRWPCYAAGEVQI